MFIQNFARNPVLVNNRLSAASYRTQTLASNLAKSQNLTSQNAPESTIGNRRGVLLPPKMPIFAFLGQAPRCRGSVLHHTRLVSLSLSRYNPKIIDTKKSAVYHAHHTRRGGG